MSPSPSRCDCVPGTCQEFSFTGRRADICAGRLLTEDQCEAYRKLWRAREIKRRTGVCIHRGEAVRTIHCEVCSKRGTTADVYSCPIMGECTERKVVYRSTPQSCLSCEHHESRS